jgi:hypothetical protein
LGKHGGGKHQNCDKYSKHVESLHLEK